MSSLASHDILHSERNRRARHDGLVIRRTRLGHGLFAGRHFRPYEIIGEIKGTVIADWDYSSRYCFDLGDIRCLEPDPPFRFMNHSCWASCEFHCEDVVEREGILADRRIFVSALERIRPGEEFTIDYAWPAPMAIPCRCGERNCRGWIVARDQLSRLLESSAARSIQHRADVASLG